MSVGSSHGAVLLIGFGCLCDPILGCVWDPPWENRPEKVVFLQVWVALECFLSFWERLENVLNHLAAYFNKFLLKFITSLWIPWHVWHSHTRFTYQSGCPWKRLIAYAYPVYHSSTITRCWWAKLHIGQASTVLVFRKAGLTGVLSRICCVATKLLLHTLCFCICGFVHACLGLFVFVTMWIPGL